MKIALLSIIPCIIALYNTVKYDYFENVLLKLTRIKRSMRNLEKYFIKDLYSKIIARMCDEYLNDKQFLYLFVCMRSCT